MGFFDNLGKKASETYRNTAEKTSKLTREMKLKSMMNDSKSKVDEIYKEIGKKVYEKHVRGENIDISQELREECSKIDAYAKELEDMRMEMLALKDLRLCVKCSAEIDLNAKFCPKCGAVQSVNKAQEVVQEVAQDEIVVTNDVPTAEEYDKAFGNVNGENQVNNVNSDDGVN